MRHRMLGLEPARETNVQAMIPVAGEQGLARRPIAAFTSRAGSRPAYFGAQPPPRTAAGREAIR